jgi:acyl-CoA synthetase (AMP-forming)/AMP-acid ligase II
MEPDSPRPTANSLLRLIEETSRTFGDAPYLLEARGARTVTFAELSEAAHRARATLAAWGIAPGARVGLLVGDPLAFSTWFLCGLAFGVWVAPLDPTVSVLNAEHVDDRVRVLSLDAVLSDRDAPEGTSVRWVNVGRAAAAPPAPAARPVAPGASGGGGVLLSSSGTTGAPKVMALPEAQLLGTARLIAAHNGLTSEDRGLNPLPLWHVNAEVVGLLATLVAGASLVLDDRFHRTGFWKIVDEFEVTWINAVPAIIARLTTRQGDETPAPRVRFLRSASAPLSPTLSETFESLAGIPVIQSYGMTEAASQICANPLRGVRKAGSVGVAVGVDVRVVGVDDGAPLASGDVGHIEIKGPTVITSYESSDYADRFDGEGWLRTGDLGYFDEDHYLFIVGRNDDVINRGGEKIYPLEIENALVGVAGVAAVAVVGQFDEVFGQVPVAYVQPADAAALAAPLARDLVARVRAATLEAFARPQRPASVRLVERFPAHATGKIRKGLLRDGEVVVAYEETL